jgi:hypothetical protein
MSEITVLERFKLLMDKTNIEIQELEEGVITPDYMFNLIGELERKMDGVKNVYKQKIIYQKKLERFEHLKNK